MDTSEVKKSIQDFHGGITCHSKGIAACLGIDYDKLFRDPMDFKAEETRSDHTA
jgi:hypothetical protein